MEDTEKKTSSIYEKSIKEIKEEYNLEDEDYQRIYNSIEEDEDSETFKSHLNKRLSEFKKHLEIKEQYQLTKEEFEKIYSEIDEKPYTDRFIKILKEKTQAYSKTKEIKEKYQIPQETYNYFFDTISKNEKTQAYTTNFNKELEENIKIYLEFEKLEKEQTPGEYSEKLMKKYGINQEGYLELFLICKKPNTYYDTDFTEKLEEKIQKYKEMWDLSENNPNFKNYKIEKNQYQEVYAKTLEEYYEKLLDDQITIEEFKKEIDKNSFIEAVKPIYIREFERLKDQYQVPVENYDKFFKEIEEEFLDNENYNTYNFIETFNNNIENVINKYTEFRKLKTPTEKTLKELNVGENVYQTYYKQVKDRYYGEIILKETTVRKLKNTLLFNCFKVGIKSIYNEEFEKLHEKYNITEEEFEKDFTKQKEEYVKNKNFNTIIFHEELEKNLKEKFKKYEEFYALENPDPEILKETGVSEKVYKTYFKQLKNKYQEKILNKSVDIRRLRTTLYYNCFKHGLKSGKDELFQMANEKYGMNKDEFFLQFKKVSDNFKKNRKFKLSQFKKEFEDTLNEKYKDYLSFYNLRNPDYELIEKTGITKKEYDELYEEMMDYYEKKLLNKEVNYTFIEDELNRRCFKKSLENLCRKKAKEYNEKYNIPELDYIKQFNRVENALDKDTNYSIEDFEVILNRSVNEKFKDYL